MARVIGWRVMACLLPAAFMAAGAEAADILVEGMVSDPSATVSVNGRAAVVQADGRYAVGVPFSDGPQTITATATNRAGEQATRTVQVLIDSQAPGRQAGSPTGTLPSTTTQATLSLTTNEPAVCRRASVANTPYSAMTLSFSASGDGRTHQALLTGLQAGGTLTTYVRCADQAQNANTDDYIISFSIAAASPPVRSNGAPTGALPAGTTQTTLSLSTNEPATCQYGTTPNQPYGAFTTPFATTGGTAHSSPLTGLAAGQAYTYYVRCKDADNQVNTDDYPINFSVAQGPPPDPGNLLTNPGFENGTTGPANWAIDSFRIGFPGLETRCVFTWIDKAQDPAGVRTGNKSVQVFCPTGTDGEDDARWLQDVAVMPNTEYVISGYVKTANIASSQGSTGVNVSAIISNEVVIPQTPDTFFGSQGAWTRLETRFNSGPHSVVRIAARLGYYSSMARGQVWFDDLRLERAGGSGGTVTLTGVTSEPGIGPAPLNGVGFTYTVGGTATGNITLRIDCTNNGSYDAQWDTSTASGFFAFVPEACNYPSVGPFTAKVRAERGGGFGEVTTPVSVTTGSPPTLTMSSLAASPASGPAPLNGVGLNYALGGTATGRITLRVDCTNNGSWDALWMTTQSSGFIPNACSYPSTGSYTVKVRTIRGGAVTDGTTQVTVTSGGGGTNQAPVVTINGASTRTVTKDQPFSLSAVVTDDGRPNPPGTLVFSWSSDEIFSPSVVDFASPGAKDTSVTIRSTGTYVLTLSAFDGERSGNDSVTVTVNPSGGTNQAPAVNIGADATVTLPNTLALNPTVSDDGKPNPPAALTYSWTKESGPGTVSFSPNAMTKNVTASFSASGTYVLKLTVSDSALSANDTLTVTVQSSGATVPACIFTGPTSVQVEERFGVSWNCPAPATVVHSSGWGAPGSDPTPSGGTAPIAPDVRPFVGEGDFTGGPGISSGWGSFMRLSEPGTAQVTLTPRDAAGNSGPARTHQVTATTATPTLTVDLTTEDGTITGTGSLSKKLKVNLTGTARGLTTVNFDCDQADGTYQETHPTIEDDLGHIPPQSSYTSSTTCTYTNSGTVAKSFTAKVEVKRQGLIKTDTLQITVNPSSTPKPDLIVTDITASPYAPTAISPVTFSVTVKNQGTAVVAAGTSFVVDIRSGGTGTTATINGPLAVGASKTAETSVALTFPKGSHTIQTKADNNGQVQESNEDNNDDKILNLVVAATPAQVIVCEPVMNSSSGKWSQRWGSLTAATIEPPVHACSGGTGQSGRLTTSPHGTTSAAGIEWFTSTPGASRRNADVSFRVPSFTNWNHLAAMAAFEPPSPPLSVGFGRIGGAVFQNQLYVEFLSRDGWGCDSPEILHNPVTIPGGGLQTNHWYRLDAQIKRLGGGDYEVKTLLLDLEQTGAPTIASTAKMFPASCMPGWYSGATTRWFIGVLSTASGLQTIVDDFTGRADP